MPKFKLETDDESYRIIGPRNEEGEWYDYGDVAVLDIDGQRFIAYCCLDESGDIVLDDGWGPKVFGIAEAPSEHEEVAYEEEDEEGESDDDGNGSDDGDDGDDGDADDGEEGEGEKVQVTPVPSVRRIKRQRGGPKVVKS